MTNQLIKQSILIEAQFLPPVAIISRMADADIVLIEAQETYQKKSYRNKCMLIGANGTRSFSIPLQKGKHNATGIRDVRISYEEAWSSQFLKLCLSNYKKSPYYDYIIDTVRDIFKRKHDYLFDLNMDLLRWIFDFLQFEAELIFTQDYLKAPDQGIEDLRDKFRPGTPLVNKQAAYPQVFLEKHGFQENMSILDLLFCCGKESINYL